MEGSRDEAGGREEEQRREKIECPIKDKWGRSGENDEGRRRRKEVG